MNTYDIIVYCGGKCGSTTLKQTFIKNGYRCEKVHNNAEYQSVHKVSHSIFDVIDKSSKDNKIYIIDVYRTPIERKISSFFENIQLHCPNYRSMTVEQLVDLFNLKFLTVLEEYHSINEVLTFYNLPLFDRFDFKNRYNIVEKDKMVFIKLLFDDIRMWSILFSTIFKKRIIMYNENMTNNKDIRTLYIQFKEIYRVPKSYLDSILCDDKEFKIYNTPDKQRDYIDYWKKRSY